MITFDDVIAQLRVTAGWRLVAIDGLPASGKSTLADQLEAELGTATIYLDDFVRPEAEWRGKVQPGFPFPYIRYADFMQTVAMAAQGDMVRYRRYDWSSGQTATDWTEIAAGRRIVVEGVSTLHPELSPLYDLRLWVDSDAKTTLAASLARGVGDWERDWRDLFMPSAALYLATDPRQRADQVLAGRGASAP